MSENTSIQRDAQGKRPHFYDSAPIDQMMSMIMVLASEVSVLTDHIDSIERVSAENGLDLAAGIARLKLDERAREAREARRQAFLGRLFYVMRKEATEAAAKETSEGYVAVIDEIAKG